MHVVYVSLHRLMHTYQFDTTVHHDNGKGGQLPSPRSPVCGVGVHEEVSQMFLHYNFRSCQQISIESGTQHWR